MLKGLRAGMQMLRETAATMMDVLEEGGNDVGNMGLGIRPSGVDRERIIWKQVM